MKKILLVCNAGMSTSMLVSKMQKAAEAKNAEVSIEAKSLSEAKNEIANVDIVLLGPQIRYELANVKKIAGSVPVEAVDMKDYGLMNGEKVLEHALEVIGS
ncbi:MAG: PTS sugar transporter subunit IIB [Eubacterium sp.]|nr:PTS sugar transporter subunit IIB [Eubacterium sp.]